MEDKNKKTPKKVASVFGVLASIFVINAIVLMIISSRGTLKNSTPYSVIGIILFFMAFVCIFITSILTKIRKDTNMIGNFKKQFETHFQDENGVFHDFVNILLELLFPHILSRQFQFFLVF